MLSKSAFQLNHHWPSPHVLRLLSDATAVLAIHERSDEPLPAGVGEAAVAVGQRHPQILPGPGRHQPAPRGGRSVRRHRPFLWMLEGGEAVKLRPVGVRYGPVPVPWDVVQPLALDARPVRVRVPPVPAELVPEEVAVVRALPPG
eukprot:CAMPEP_0172528434 /NCGR_PEP_ID=MMETSP1067-20121228/2833_1 /TAXON_ID=265564 ORGANISM="Thalassiosira punctigera, Strain Tpunct2005C2" /NCGR_SAMPLE_ID=MMETSP1067 /ASSEMBLY_ACC=CAM_ASM_000444 /LENGTH=144 /DNA_ID=CAMNT_0013312337 /DNA_START=191 /DNA_END=621 /DNA_ORIENTATION=+